MQKDGFELLVAFPQINATYENLHLFAVFGERLLDKRRHEIDKILGEYGMTEYDEFELLKRSGAKLQQIIMSLLNKKIKLIKKQ